MALSPIPAALPSLAGTLPDLFRRTDDAAPRTDDVRAQTATLDRHDSRDADAGETRTSEDVTRMIARHAALGPLTYGRRAMTAAAAPAAPISLRGAHLDVRG